ncbi:MAG: hypothetical protein IPJ03_17900 [Ignavibacteriales bacterium]|nr:hypothetical protein [Ignavibacteriales bacterium]
MTQLLREAGVVTSRASLSATNKAALIEEWKDGGETKKITEKYHISESTLWNIVKGMRRKVPVRTGWNSPQEAKLIVLPKMKNIAGRAYAGKINIYKSKADGDYYYGTEPMAYRDRVIEKKLSADYAFDTVGKWNAKKKQTTD